MAIWQRMSELVATIARMGSVTGALREVAGVLLGPGHRTPPEMQVAFTIAIVALSAKMARSDGVVVQSEWEAFQAIMAVPPEEADNVRRVFDLAKKDSAGYEAYAEQIAGLLKDNPRFRQTILEGMFHIAAADGIMHPKEDAFLAVVAARLGFSAAALRHVRSRFVHDEAGGPYEVLGLDPSASDDEIRRHYRRLVARNHPDLLIGQGLPEEFIAVATRKLAAINAAYEELARERKL